jgi:endonuclease/exonuclease/phosphatase family metal-dependent hydrolase
MRGTRVAESRVMNSGSISFASIGMATLVSLACSSQPGTRWELRAATFNAALAPGFEPLASQRLPLVVSALAEAAQQLDVLCVQEFWLESDFAQLRATSTASLPYVVHPAPLPGAGECTEAELGTLGQCVQNQCANTDAEALVACLQTQCSTEVGSLSGGCLGCLINQLDDFSQCAPTGHAPIASDPAIFGGDYDTGLLSRYPISEQAVLPLDAYFQRGAVLYARIEVPQLGPVHTFCTHLSSPLGVIPYVGPDGSWDGEHARESEQLFEFIRAKQGNLEPVLVLGDLNMGFAVDGVGAVLPGDFAALLADGLTDPYLDSGQAQCSECNDNSFRAADTPNDLIDHALIQGFPGASASVTRVFTGPVSLAAGLPPTNLSDHYGVRLQLSSR